MCSAYKYYNLMYIGLVVGEKYSHTHQIIVKFDLWKSGLGNEKHKITTIPFINTPFLIYILSYLHSLVW